MLSFKNGLLTPMVQSDYDAIAEVMRQIPARSLEIGRAEKPPFAPEFMRFVLFEPGLHGSPMAVMGVWFGPNGKPQGSLFRKCNSTALTDWDVCQSV
jgi:hypothetical protein